jgi:hypothetical protein
MKGGVEMLVPRVSVISHKTEEELSMDNIQTNPVYRYHRGVELPPNVSQHNVTYTYELLLNGKSSNLFTDVVVLSEAALKVLVDEINELEKYLTWEESGVTTVYDPLVVSTATIPMIIKRIVAMEDATTWGSFDEPLISPDYDDDLQQILVRIEAIKQAVEYYVPA